MVVEVEIRFGTMRITVCEDGSLWLSNSEGEGIAVEVEQIDELLLTHFKENF